MNLLKEKLVTRPSTATPIERAPRKLARRANTNVKINTDKQSRSHTADNVDRRKRASSTSNSGVHVMHRVTTSVDKTYSTSPTTTAHVSQGMGGDVCMKRKEADRKLAPRPIATLAESVNVP